MAFITLVTIFCTSAITVNAASQTTNYNQFTTPSSSDYAYWNGKKVVKASGTTVSEIKWMQASLNYCIKYKGLKASYISVDGSFGPASKSVTLAFQKKYGLKQDGSFGPSTISKMKTILNLSPNPIPSPVVTDKNWLWPCKVQSQSCEWWDTYYHKSHAHRGIDIRTSYADVYASKSGTVYQMGYNKARGYWMVIDHGNGYYSEYQHLNKYYVTSGKYVKQGTVIAQSGNTGQGSGAHLHFEIMYLGKTGLAKQYGNYFNSTSKFVNVNPQKSTYAHFYTSKGIYVKYFSDKKGINYIYK